MKNHKLGFIQIPILIIMILGTLLTGSVAYIGVDKFGQYKENKTKSEKLENDEIAQLKQEIDTLKSRQDEQTKQKTQSVVTKPIEKTKQETIASVEQPITITATIATTSVNTEIDNQYKLYLAFKNNRDKVMREIKSADDTFILMLNSGKSENYSLAATQAQSIIDYLNSAYKDNLDSTIDLSFSTTADNLQNAISNSLTSAIGLAQIWKTSYDYESKGAFVAASNVFRDIDSIKNDYRDVILKCYDEFKKFNKEMTPKFINAKKDYIYNLLGVSYICGPSLGTGSIDY